MNPLPFPLAAVAATAHVDPWILGFSFITVAATLALGFWSAKKSRTVGDFFVAGRAVSAGWNASALSGEFLSAASFLGLAGLVMSAGYDALWYPACYACGYLFILLFIAGPLRRFGAYTLPDFAEGRYDSPRFRQIAVCFVLFIGLVFTLPQMKGAGVTLGYIFKDADLRGWLPGAWLDHDAAGHALIGLPYWGGVALVGAVITLNVALGGMKGITLLQAFHYWLKVFAIVLPAFVMMAIYGFYGTQLAENSTTVSAHAAAAEVTGTVLVNGVPIPANSNGAPTLVPVRATGGAPARATTPPANAATSLAKDKALARKPLPSAATTTAPADAEWISPFGPLTTKAVKAAAATLRDPAARKAYLDSRQRPYALLYTYSLILALVCGTAGLPHLLVRFYTNPDGVSARRTTFWVLIFIGMFYLFPPLLGALGRNQTPDLYATGATDQVVLQLPARLVPGVWGGILSGLTCAGVFAAFMSTFSGLLVSMAGALAHDIYGCLLRPNATPAERVWMFKISAVLLGALAIVLGSQVQKMPLIFLVGQAFAVAASSYFPFLLLSIWWRGMTMRGAVTGMLAGGLLALACTTVVIVGDINILSPEHQNALTAFWAAHPLARILCEQPAIVTVPLALALMVLVSQRHPREVPGDLRAKMLALHAPEKLGLHQPYIQEHESFPPATKPI